MLKGIVSVISRKPSKQRWQCLIYNDTLKTFVMGKYEVVVSFICGSCAKQFREWLNIVLCLWNNLRHSLTNLLLQIWFLKQFICAFKIKVTKWMHEITRKIKDYPKVVSQLSCFAGHSVGGRCEKLLKLYYLLN